MIVRGLHVMPNPGFAQSLNDLANRARVAASPDQLDALFALALVEWSSAQFFWHQLDAADCAVRMSLGVFRIA
jgi:hypothetical protein